MGFETLADQGGADHPFIISKLGSVVAEQDRPDVFFFGDQRRRLHQTQLRIERSARYVTLLTQESISLWRESFGSVDNTLLIPGAADRELPAAGADPYPSSDRPRCLFAGNIYDQWSQAEVHRLIVDKLNRLGELLAARGARLLFLGRGDTSRLDPAKVAALGAVEHERSWDYMRFADEGVVLAFGRRRNVNESTKIYHYPRMAWRRCGSAGLGITSAFPANPGASRSPWSSRSCETAVTRSAALSMRDTRRSGRPLIQCSVSPPRIEITSLAPHRRAKRAP